MTIATIADSNMLESASNTFDKTHAIRSPATSTMVDVGLELAARWVEADRDLDSARRHVEIATGVLWRLLPDRLDPEDLAPVMVERWAREAMRDLQTLAGEHELPAGGR